MHLSSHSPLSSRRLLPFALLALTSLCLALAPAITSANPVPEIAMLIDVSQYQATVPAENCEQIQQHSQGLGARYFDVYFYPVYYIQAGGLGIGSLQATFTWPEEWQLISAQPVLGSGTFEQTASNEFTMNYDFFTCPIIEYPHGVLHVARFCIDVTSTGYFRSTAYSGSFCYPTTEYWEYSYGYYGSGKAGEFCGYCDRLCSLVLPNDQMLDPQLLELETEEGTSTQGEIYATFEIWHPPLEIMYLATAPWLTIEETYISLTERLLTVTADATGLATGYHMAYVRVISECVDCAEVILTVTPSGTPVESSTWGQIKASMR
jgi:hypothetical protein